jgi:hypothetical protein
MEPCDECGWAAAGGRSGCRARFDALLVRDFSDARYFGTHRLFVDTYCLQHPDQFCRSAKSLAAHLVGLCWILEGGASAAVGPDRLHRWLNGPRQIGKPALPERRGTVTIGDLPADAEPDAWAAAVRRWAASTWEAHSALQPEARAWLAQAARN